MSSIQGCNKLSKREETTHKMPVFYPFADISLKRPLDKFYIKKCPTSNPK